MIANIVKTQLQVIMAKNIVVVSVVILQCLEKNLQAGKMANHLKEIGQDLELNLKNGVTRFLKEIIIIVNIVTKKNIYRLIILLNGQKMKANVLKLTTELLYVLNVMAKFTEEILHIGQKINVNVVKLLKKKVFIAIRAQQKNSGK